VVLTYAIYSYEKLHSQHSGAISEGNRRINGSPLYVLSGHYKREAVSRQNAETCGGGETEDVGSVSDPTTIDEPIETTK
jgi:hypothetical protein